MANTTKNNMKLTLMSWVLIAFIGLTFVAEYGADVFPTTSMQSTASGGGSGLGNG